MPMKLDLDQLLSCHPSLRGHPVDYAKCGALAFARGGHASPTSAKVEHDEAQAMATIEWTQSDAARLNLLDTNRITEDGAEAVALTYVNTRASWVVKRRLQRGESADWLLRNETGWLALEVSGLEKGNPRTRLLEKKRQIAKCTLPADRLAVVVAFDSPTILVGTV